MSTDQQGGRSAAVRGATTATENTAASILEATEELLTALLERNAVSEEDIVSVIFTMTPDLDATFPASAARRLDLATVPLLCAAEIAVPGAVPRCIRVLMHLYPATDPKHVYLRGAEHLRADLTDG
jgi:chorismate mutase